MHLEKLTVGIGFTRGPSPRNRLPMVLLRCRLLVARITAVVNSGLKPLNGEYVCNGSLGPPAFSRLQTGPAGSWRSQSARQRRKVSASIQPEHHLDRKERRGVLFLGQIAREPAASTRWPGYPGHGCWPPRHRNAQGDACKGLPSPQAGSPRRRRRCQIASVPAPSCTSRQPVAGRS